jgi:hypothetical protein
MWVILEIQGRKRVVDFEKAFLARRARSTRWRS